jgi:hypothetical protein
MASAVDIAPLSEEEDFTNPVDVADNREDDSDDLADPDDLFGDGDGEAQEEPE